jgi:hypothetical protein
MAPVRAEGVPVRIGTWNLAGQWEPEHERFLAEADCDVWLLTEVNERVELPGYERHLTEGVMRPRIRWAGVYSRPPLWPMADPHVASAMAVVDGTTYCSSILPWRSCPEDETWAGHNHTERTSNALDVLVGKLLVEYLVWGGDWNHALSGPEEGGNKTGRRHVLDAVDRLGLQVPTAVLPHWIEGHLSIDHIAVGAHRRVTDASRVIARGLSDHDCYVVDVAADGLTRTDRHGP